MSEPPTMLIRETDDDKTLIDPIRLLDPDPPFEGSGRALPGADPCSGSDWIRKEPSWLWHGPLQRLRGRRVMEVGVVAVLVVVLGALAYRQRRTSDELRAMIAELSAGRWVTQPQDTPGLPTQVLARSGSEPRPASSRRDVVPASREEAESRGARLVGSNDFEGALVHYLVLVDRFPNDSVFRDFVFVLKAKLRCSGPVEAASEACP